MNPVLDASVFVSALSPNERQHARALALFESHPADRPYSVPALFRVEVVSALVRRSEKPDVVDLVDALIRSRRFHAYPVDAALLEEATNMARYAGLRAYDAVYAALAHVLGVELMTIDDEMASRLARGGSVVQVRSNPR